jgi:hypothetical protein
MPMTMTPRRRDARIHARKQEKKRRNENRRHYVLSGGYALAATLGLWIAWSKGLIPAAGDPFIVVLFGGLGVGIGFLVAAYFVKRG